MKWELTPELVDQIIYAMENQGASFCFDIEEGRVVAESGVPKDQDRYYSLPRWRSPEGFHLMERFVAELRNPLLRENLREALGAGRGVFRQFKDALRTRPEVEKLWFSFKEREMRRVVYDWYNDIRELHGLQKLPPPYEEREETEELILSDFLLAQGTGGREDALRKLDKQSFADSFPGADAERVEAFYHKSRHDLLMEEPAIVIRAEAPSGDIAGLVWGVEDEEALTGERIVELIQLAVSAEYRGLGLGRALLEAFLATADSRGVSGVTTWLRGQCLEAVDLMRSVGFADRSLEMMRRF